MGEHISNKEYPDRPELAIEHAGAGHEVKAFVYDAKGLKGVWTTDDRWIPEAQIADVEPKFPDTTCEGSAT